MKSWPIASQKSLTHGRSHIWGAWHSIKSSHDTPVLPPISNNYSECCRCSGNKPFGNLEHPPPCFLECLNVRRENTFCVAEHHSAVTSSFGSSQCLNNISIVQTCNGNPVSEDTEDCKSHVEWWDHECEREILKMIDMRQESHLVTWQREMINERMRHDVYDTFKKQILCEHTALKCT